MERSDATQATERQIRFRRACIIGFGLMGSSLARALRRGALCDAIVACDRDPGVLDRARALGLADAYEEAVVRAVRDADLVVLAVPVGAMGAVARAAAPALAAGCIVTDLGSVKQAVIRDVGAELPAGVHFVPAHPVAGTEKSGPEHGFAELFEGRYTILTPVPTADPAAEARVVQLWEAVGARVERMDAGHHDRAMAIVSHLPHLIAYTIVATAVDLEADRQEEVVRYSAGGFRDFTRIAASDPVMWRDIFLANKEAVLEMLQRFGEDLAALQRAIRWGEGETLERVFRRTRALRRRVVEAGQAGTFLPTEAGTGPGLQSES